MNESPAPKPNSTPPWRYRPGWYREPKAIVLLIVAAVLVFAVWMAMESSRHNALREEASSVCHEDVFARYGGESSGLLVFATYVGEPTDGTFQFRLVDTEARFTWTCLANNRDSEWNLSVFKND